MASEREWSVAMQNHYKCVVYLAGRYHVTTMTSMH